MKLLLYLNQNAQPTFPGAHQMCMQCHLKIRLEILIDNKKISYISTTAKETDESWPQMLHQKKVPRFWLQIK